VAKDDEFRKVAEDVRALVRSLARDFREAVDQSRGSGYRTSEAFRHGLKGVAEEARRGVRTGLYGHPAYHRWKRNCWGYGWGAPPSAPPPPPPGAPGSTPGSPAAGAPPWGRPGGYGPYWQRPPRHPHQRSRAPMPPVRRRWDATTVIGLLAVLFGVAWLLGALGAIHVSIEGVVAVGLMLLGASLIITGRTDWSLSRRTWPMWLGAGLVAVLVATSSTFGIGNALQSVQFGNMSSTPPTGATVHGGFGNLTVQASHMVGGDTVHIDSVAGNTVVTELPKLVPVHVNARVLAGQICVFGHNAGNGVGANTNQTVTPSGASGTPITLDVHQVFGQISIGDGC
jgi:hypothetical protein